MLRNRVQIVFDENDPLSKSRTHQSFAKDADINNIMAKYSRTGILGNPTLVSDRKPMFGDFSNIPDYNERVLSVQRVNDAFMALPSDVRAKFLNDPALALEFLSDEKNHDEARKLGMLPKLTIEELKAKEVPAVKAENPAPAGA